MKKLLWIVVFLVESVSLSAHAANSTVAYTGQQDQKLQTQINAPKSNGASGVRVGDFHQGGVIYWLDPSQQFRHGLVADIADQPGGSAYAWDASPPTITGATGNKAYAGKNSLGGNTYIILNAIIATNAQAAQACASNRSGGYTDWYLPSIMELELMYDQQMTITQTALAFNGSAFVDVNDSSTGYWSSTEHDGFTAWYFGFANSAQFQNNKDALFRVRCIRAF